MVAEKPLDPIKKKRVTKKTTAVNNEALVDDETKQTEMMSEKDEPVETPIKKKRVTKKTAEVKTDDIPVDESE